MNKPEGDFKCVLTHKELSSGNELIELMTNDESNAELTRQLKSMFDDKLDNTSAINNLIGDKQLGVTGKDTNRFMSYLAFQEFYNWVITKSLKGDKHINWLLGSIRHATFMERAKSINDVDVQNKVNKYKTTSKATFTLGDSSDALLKLKAQLESKNK